MEELIKRAEIILEKLNIQEIRTKFEQIEKQTLDPDFWKDSQAATEKMKEFGALQKEIETAENLQKYIAEKDKISLEKSLSKLEIYLYLSGKFDKSNAILTIHAGQGGVDAMDWAEILSRMYKRFFERRGWKAEIINETKGEEAGIKNISILVDGEFAYGYLKNEQGTHRLVRLSPFNADKLRHTSFAMVEVLPQVEEDADVTIKEDDLEWDFYRASSHGGQNVQKVSSAVRLSHKPTGIVVTCQIERSQAQNREYALKLLKAKLWALQEEKRLQEKKDLRGEYIPASWGTQIRSYVLHPYQLIKDLRTQVETSNTADVLDGNLDVFIEAELKKA